MAERIGEAGLPGVHEDTIRNVELGHRQASGPLLTAWAKALGVNPLDVWQPPRESDSPESDDTSNQEGAA